MRNRSTTSLLALSLVLAAGLLVPRAARAQLDDAILFTAIVPPNVLLLLDNSGSMNHVIWHPGFDPSVTPTCTQFVNDATYFIASSTNLASFEIKKGNHTYCGNTRLVFEDTGTGSEATRWDGRYLNWYFSDAADAYAAEITATNNASFEACVGGASYDKYRRSRISALRQSMLDVTCAVNQGRDDTDGIRFGTAQFREPGSDNDPNGAFVGEGIEDNTPQHANDMEAHINNLKADTWTPLGESLFQMYTYFMSRTATDRPVGQDGTTVFPGYGYEADGDYNPSNALPDPVQYHCQRNFIVIVTDGEPTKDDFDVSDPSDEAQGFASFSNLIGDFHTGDGETEVPGCCSELGLYLDDIAAFMQSTDFRPDLQGDQFIDVYTVGFTTTAAANALLQKTADNGNGLFFFATNPDELKEALKGALLDIIEKTQSFTASTVPASRTVDGADFYTSFFLPLAADPFWQGHLQAYTITAAGEIQDKNGNCALDDPTNGECNSGPFLPTAEPYWDAGSAVPAPGSRSLYTSKLNAAVPPVSQRVAFTTSLTYTDLSLQSFAADGDATTPAPNRTYPDSIALNEEGLADEIVQYIRGCEFGTGVLTTDVDGTLQQACDPRDWLLGDIFHSNPIVVTKPSAFIFEPSYQSFKATYALRDRVIYAGSNGGFVHAFDAGALDTSVTPNKYLPGSGVELFGFMPWEVRQNIRFQAVPTGPSEHYYVDGSPDAADVWIHPTATTTSKASDGSEWKTVLVGGLRQGGHSYYALDITDPSAAGYPGYLWEFPEETEVVLNTIMGQTWGTPVIHRIKVRVGLDDNGGAGYERWVAFVTAGYDESGNPNHINYNATASQGRALFVLDLKTGDPIAVIPITTTATGDAESYATAMTPAVLDVDFDGFADLVYFGDLGGNMWKLVVKPVAHDRVNDGTGFLTQPNWTLKKFFKAPRYKDGPDWLYKSFFFPPSATLYKGKLILAFGTGERTDLGFEGPTNTDDDNNRFYVVSDLDPYELRSTPYATLGETDLQDVTSNETCQTITGRGFFFVADNGEKFVTNSEIFARDVIAASYVPTDLTDPCETGGGEAALYVFDIICSEGFFNRDTSPERKLDLGKGFPTDPRISMGVGGEDNLVFIEKSRAEIESIEQDDLPGNGNLLYWREMP